MVAVVERREQVVQCACGEVEGRNGLATPTTPSILLPPTGNDFPSSTTTTVKAALELNTRYCAKKGI